MKKVRKIRLHGVMTETLKTKGSNFALDPGFNWKLVECFKQQCCTHVRRTIWSCCMILYALKFIQFVVRETS